jgi:hypothetical protein
VVVSTVGVSLAALSVSGVLEGPTRRAAALGGMLSALNTLCAYALSLWGVRRSMNAFMGAVLGGMVGRMGVMLAAIVALVVFLDVPKWPLAIAVLGYFVPFLVLELSLLQKLTTAPRETR